MQEGVLTISIPVILLNQSNKMVHGLQAQLQQVTKVLVFLSKFDIDRM